MGGGLLQQVNRDTLRFAMKANAMRDGDGIWRDVAKTPATDPTKASKAGRQAVVLRDGRLTVALAQDVTETDNLLVPVWRDGAMLVRHSFEQLRARAA
jgi:nicotinamide phosphoribosyltransferase